MAQRTRLAGRWLMIAPPPPCDPAGRRSVGPTTGFRPWRKRLWRGCDRSCRPRQSLGPGPRRVATPRPIPHEHGSRLEPVKAGLLHKNRTETTVSGSYAVQEAHGFLVEVT